MSCDFSHNAIVSFAFFLVFACMQDSERLRQQYPGRILSARYEDLAERPLHFAQRLLSFAGLEMTPGQRQYIWNITSSAVEAKEKAGGTLRRDSKQTASNWRVNNTTYTFVANIDKYCTDLYARMGYFPLHSEREMKNLSIPVYRDVKDLPWLWSP